jgi:hypothetical protein
VPLELYHSNISELDRVHPSNLHPIWGVIPRPELIGPELISLLQSIVFRLGTGFRKEELFDLAGDQ